MVKKLNTKKTLKRPKKKTAPRRIKKRVQKRKLSQRKELKRRRKGLKREKQPSAVVLMKSEENPIIAPKPENEWEAWQTFNPGVILLDNKVHFLYRAIGQDAISRLGYAVSSDGFHVDERLPEPVYEHLPKPRSFNIFSYTSGGGWGGAEDPRIVRVNDEDVLYMTYTACGDGLRVVLTSIKVDDFLKRNWKWKKPVLISPPGEVHKNWVIFPEKIKRIKDYYAILHSLSPEVLVSYFDSLEFAEGQYIHSLYKNGFRKNCWDSQVRGAGTPPIKTKYGWLIFYHAITESEPGKYKVGAMILDLAEPSKVLYRSQEPVLEPEEFYENQGFKPGIVYASGAVVRDGMLLVYYGGADSCVNVAYVDFDEFLEALTKEAKPKLKTKPLKKKKYL